MRGARRTSGSGGFRLDDAEFRRRVDELKSRTPMSGVVARAVKLKRAGREYQGLCPFHQEKTPSFYVNDAKGFAHCFGCAWHGDIIRFVMDREGCGFREAYQRLANDDLPTWTPSERAKAVAEDRLAELEKEKEARRFFDESVPLAGTPGEVYLRARGITIAAPDDVRFGMVPSWQNKETGVWGRKRPAVICGARDGAGAIVGIQRIFFKNDDPSLGKKDCKLSLGTINGAALRLGPPARRILLCEGPEDGLSLAQERPDATVWVTFGTSNMPAVRYPDIVRSITICSQNDSAAEKANVAATAALFEQGYMVEVAYPDPAFKDWNDQLRGIRQ